jgi:hypothetical protein
MIKYLLVVFTVSLLFEFGCNSHQTNTTKTEEGNKEQIALADSILSYFQQEQFDKIEFHFSDKLKAQLNKEQLAVVWAQLNTQAGKYSNSQFYKAEKVNAIGDRITYECYFGTQKLYFQLVLGKDNQIIGLFFMPNHPILSFGNWREETILQLLQQFHDDMIINWIKYLGVKDMKNWLHSKNSDITFKNEYTNICDICNDILCNELCLKLLSEEGIERREDIILRKTMKESTIFNLNYKYI